MIVEKPAWVHHSGLQIFSLDIQPSGNRFATAGGDHKVRIWSMKSLSGKDSELDLASPKLLATLRDHFGSVNCVRWTKSGQLIASGSDHLVLIHERKPGTGTVEFGSGEPPNVENWKVLLTLRGHTADVVDLGWSPDDSMLASCSLDNTVRIWQASNGSVISVLTGHKSLVKGVAWDPIGSFLASQSDDKSVIIWQTSNWNLTQKVEGPWSKTVGNTFFRRLGWSPCGHFITTTNGFQKPSHTAQVLERGDWNASFNFVGHNAPVVAVRFNHSMFRKQSLPAATDGTNDTNVGNPSQKSVAKEFLPYNVIAMGSQDCNITVWTTSSPRPVFVGKHFFSQSVVDLSWSPDGYSLFCCSLDGTVAAFHFEAKELGYKVSDAEMEEFKKSRYGDLRGRQGTLAESPAQLLLEAAAAKKLGGAPTTNQLHGSEAVKSTDHKVSDTGGKPTRSPSSKAATHAPSPVKQREYRRPDGRRRIIPEPVGLPSREEGISNGRLELPVGNNKPDKCGDGMEPEVGEKRKLPEEFSKSDLLAKRSNGIVVDKGVASTARATLTNNIMLEPNTAATRHINVEPVDILRTSDVSDGVLSIKVQALLESAEGSMPICLEAKPTKGRDNSFLTLGAAATAEVIETEVTCSQGGDVRWRDRLKGKATAMTGNANFLAVGCDDGSLQVYTMAGRRALPSILVGSAAAFMDCDGGWNLLLLTRGATMHVWDLLQAHCVVHESVIPLLQSSLGSFEKGSTKVISARLSRAGSPLIILANGYAFLFHIGMKCWLRVADDAFPASNFVSTWSAQSFAEGELASIQAEAGQFGEKIIPWGRTLTEEKNQTRAHLESQMASSIAMNSPKEYRHHLLAYARFLARETDEERLRELCEDLLGPPRSDADMVASKKTSKWDSFILGMQKHELLKTEVLPAMASNRAVQRLLNEFADLLSEYELQKDQSFHGSAEEIPNPS